MTRPEYKLAVDMACREQGVIIPNTINKTWRFIEACWHYDFPITYAVSWVVKHKGVVP